MKFLYYLYYMQLHVKGVEGFSVKEVINKMKKLRQKYKKEKDKGRKSGNGSSRPWKCFNKMDNILSIRHNVNPPLVVDSMSRQDNKEQDTSVGKPLQQHVCVTEWRDSKDSLDLPFVFDMSPPIPFIGKWFELDLYFYFFDSSWACAKVWRWKCYSTEMWQVYLWAGNTFNWCTSDRRR